jgi:hypothetical protein
MKKLCLVLAVLCGAAALAGGLSSSANAYGGGATHDMWQIGVSFNCNNADFCGSDLGGFWGWAEFDRSTSDGTITGDAEFAGCGHTTGGGGPGNAGAGHISVDITAAHIAPGGPDDPPGVNVFYIDHNVVTSSFQGHTFTVIDDPEFMGDSGMPSDPGHYAFHPVAGIAGEVQVAYRPAR